MTNQYMRMMIIFSAMMSVQTIMPATSEIPAHHVSPYATCSDEFLINRKTLIEAELSDAQERARHREIKCCEGSPFEFSVPYYKLRKYAYRDGVICASSALAVTGNPVPAILCLLSATAALPLVKSTTLHKPDSVAVAEVALIKATLAKRKEKQD